MNIIDKFSPGHEITPEQRLNDWLPQLKRHYNGDTITLLSCDIGSSNFGNHSYLIETPDGLAVCYHERTPIVDLDCDIYPDDWGIVDIEKAANELLEMRQMGLYSHISDLHETAKEISGEYASEIYQRFLKLDERV